MPKKPFGGKAKKAQLQAKKQRNLGKLGAPVGKGNLRVLRGSSDYSEENSAYTSGTQQLRSKGKTRYELQFKKETADELQKCRELAMLPLRPDQSSVSAKDQYFEPYHDFPKRPAWNGTWSKEKLELNEQRSFRQYVTRMLKSDIYVPKPSKESGEDDEEDDDTSDHERVGDSADGDHEDHDEQSQHEEEQTEATRLLLSGLEKELSYFELNLETWRQLWRVLEKSDVLLIILDVRYAAATFPPSLYNYIISKGKELIIVLNKIDLIPSPLAAAWKNYFVKNYPSVHIVYFTSFPSYNLFGIRENKRGMKIRRKKTVFSIVKEASQQIWDICNTLFGDKVDLSSWKNKIEGAKDVETKIIHEPYDHTKDGEKEGGYLTIGTLGHPNVGKSSLINSLCGKKVVSVSKTPGHTKHFQTIFLTKTVRLCDCPGLVFPSKVPKPLQVLMGSFPIAQLREPYSVVQFLAERLDLVTMLDLTLPEGERKWSAFLICDTWAVKKGFTTARTSRPDTYRAANMILRFALDGRICLTFEPPGYTESDWSDHPDTLLAEEVTAKKRELEYKRPTIDDDEDEEEGEDTQEEEYDDDDDDTGGDGDKTDGGNEENDEYDSDEDEDEEDDDEPAPVAKNPFALLANESR